MVPSGAANTTGTRRQSTRHAQHPPQGASGSASASTANNELFLEPMMGMPLSLYVDKDVPEREKLVDLITVSRFSIEYLVFALHECACPRRAVLTTLFGPAETWRVDIKGV